MFSPAREHSVRFALEKLSTDCLQAATMAAFLLSGNDPDKVRAPEIGRIAAEMAFAIRLQVGSRVRELMASEGAEEMLEKLAVDIAKERTP
jgi:hypothetical protein